MAFLSLLLVGFLVLFSSHGMFCFENGDEANMEEDELFGLFDVMGSLLEDPNWAQTHPQPCTNTPWPGIECEFQLLQENKNLIFHVTKIHLGPDTINPPCKNSAKLSQSIKKLPYLKTLSLISCFTDSPVSLTNPLFANLSSNLEILALVSNPTLSGEIPSSLSNLANLKILYLSENSLTGKIPREIGGFVNLQQLDLSHNNLTGSIPEEIGNLQKLQILDLSWNYLQEMVPVSISKLQFLEKLDLSWNKFQGNLPHELGNLKRLVLLDLSHNLLTGPISENFSGLEELQYLIMEGNLVNSVIPSFIGSLINLRVLSFSGCGLTGPIYSSEISNLSNLTALSLDNNSLSGTVPIELGVLPELNMLNLSGNMLTGELLFSQDFVSKLGMRLDVRGNNGLCTTLRKAENSRMSLQIPSCSSSLVSGNSNKTREENRPDPSKSMKPIMYEGDLSSNVVNSVGKKFVLFSFVVFIVMEYF